MQTIQQPITHIGVPQHLRPQDRHTNPRPTSILFAKGQDYSRRLSNREVRVTHIIRSITQLISIAALIGIVASAILLKDSDHRDAVLGTLGAVTSLLAIIGSFQSSGLDSTKEKRTRRATDVITCIANAINTADSIKEDIGKANNNFRNELETHNYLDSIGTLKEYIDYIATKLNEKKINGISPKEMANEIYEVLKKVSNQTQLQRTPFVKALGTIDEFLNLCKSDMETLRGDREPAIFVTNEQFNHVTEKWNALESIFPLQETIDNQIEQKLQNKSSSQTLHNLQAVIIPVGNAGSETGNTTSETN